MPARRGRSRGFTNHRRRRVPGGGALLPVQPPEPARSLRYSRLVRHRWQKRLIKESTKTGILILAMLAVTALAAGFLGWVVRLQGPSPQSAVVLAADGPSTNLLRPQLRLAPQARCTKGGATAVLPGRCPALTPCSAPAFSLDTWPGRQLDALHRGWCHVSGIWRRQCCR